MSDRKPTIHKRVSPTKGDRGRVTWTICDPTQMFKDDAYSMDNPEFVKWCETNKNRWEHVTCSKCIDERFK